MNLHKLQRYGAGAILGLLASTSVGLAEVVITVPTAAELLDWLISKGAAIGSVVLVGLVWLATVGSKHFHMFEDAFDILADIFGPEGEDDHRRRDGWWAQRKQKKERDRLASVVIEPYEAPAQPVRPAAEMTHRTAIPSSGAARHVSLEPDAELVPDASPAKPRLTALQLARQGLPKRSSALSQTDPFEKFAAQIEAQKARLQQTR